MWRAQRILTGLLIGVLLFLALTMAAPLPVRVGTSLAAAFAVGNRRTSTLNVRQGIRMQRHLQGLAIRRAYKQSLGNGPGEEVYTLYAQPHDGARITLADSLSGKPSRARRFTRRRGSAALTVHRG